MKRTIYIYNTASRSKSAFECGNGPIVGMYTCGPTVYNSAHIGNLRTYIFEDVLKRALTEFGYPVNHVMNITDVGHLTSDADTGDDKMENGALREGKTVWQIADHYTAEFRTSMAALNIIEPSIWAKATDHIPEMIAMVKSLEDKGFTYKTADGIYFDTGKFPRYCDFARLDPDSMQAGSRVDMGEKRSLTDFALWKFSPHDKKRQMEWESPWGKGFPGWHIECSAMALKYLSQPLDIHCGGIDHIRVHHTNEIAQSEAATGKQFARYWLHGEFLVVDKGKMAKSGDGFVTLRTAQDKGIDPLAYRMFCYTAHYRSPLSFSWEGLQGSAQGLINLKKQIAAECGSVSESSAYDQSAVIAALEPFYAAVADDMNMAVAIASIWELCRSKSIVPTDKHRAIELADQILGLNLFSPPPVVQALSQTTPGAITVAFTNGKVAPETLWKNLAELIDKRSAARQQKDYAAADALRAELAAIGAQVKDLPGGSVECTLV